MSQRGARRSELAGQGLVEFAIVAPLFFILVFLIIEGALFMNAQATIDNATREGARAAALCGSSTIPTTYTYQGVSTSSGGCSGLAQSVVYAHLGILKALPPNNPKVSPSCPLSTGCAAGNPIVLQTTYYYSFLIPTLLGLGPIATVTSSAQEVSQQ